MKEKDQGKVIINLRKHHKILKTVSNKHGVPMGALARDLIIEGLARIEAGDLEISKTTSFLKGSTT